MIITTTDPSNKKEAFELRLEGDEVLPCGLWKWLQVAGIADVNEGPED